MSEQATTYQKVELQRHPRNPLRETPEARFWKQFKSPADSHQVAGITHLNFCPTAPHHLAVTSSTRVLLYDGASGNLLRTISRFKDVAYSGTFRKDGKLVVAGSADGLVQVFDANSRLILRTFKGHKAAVRTARFTSDMYQIITAGDDKTIRRWDMPTDKQISLLSGHTDYVRTAYESAHNPNLWLTGSYDHSLKMWDLRTNSCVSTMVHGAPVEDILALPGGSLVISAGDNFIKVWDILSGGRMVHTFSNHQKTITSLALDNASSRLLSGSLDQMVKFYDLTSYNVTHSIKVSQPILSVGISLIRDCAVNAKPSEQMLAIGMLDGSLSLRRREAKELPTPLDQATRESMIRTGSYRYFLRGTSYTPNPEDVKVEALKKQKLREYDNFLKKFQYRDALDASLKTRHAVVVASVMEELVERGGLRVALRDRDEAHLIPVLKFVIRNITNPHYAQLLHDVALILLDEYNGVLGRSMLVDELFHNLRYEIRKETELQKRLCSLQGILEMYMASSTTVGFAAPLATTPANSDTVPTTTITSPPLKGLATNKRQQDVQDIDPAVKKKAKNDQKSE